jgi:hypothetical protein
MELEAFVEAAGAVALKVGAAVLTKKAVFETTSNSLYIRSALRTRTRVSTSTTGSS